MVTRWKLLKVVKEISFLMNMIKANFNLTTGTTLNKYRTLKVKIF